jgi:dolichyl-phosphate beta-glucosyltransferase
MTDQKPIYLTVVVPAFNEEKRVGASLKRIRDYLGEKRWPSEIIVVDDGSLDATSEVAAKELEGFPNRVLKNEENRGKGYSVRRGMLEAQGEFALFSDADLSTPIEEVEALIGALGRGAHVAIGSRAAEGAAIEIHQPWVRENLGKLFNAFLQALVIRGIKDTQCGFKCFKQEVVGPIFSRMTVERWAFDVEILYLARRLGYTIAEVPVRWRNSPATKVSAGADGLRMLLDSLRIRYRHRSLAIKKSF